MPSERYGEKWTIQINENPYVGVSIEETAEYDCDELNREATGLLAQQRVRQVISKRYLEILAKTDIPNLDDIVKVFPGSVKQPKKTETRDPNMRAPEKWITYNGKRYKVYNDKYTHKECIYVDDKKVFDFTKPAQPAQPAKADEPVKKEEPKPVENSNSILPKRERGPVKAAREI